MCAVFKGHNQIVQLLLEQPAIDVNRQSGVDGSTALGLAAFHGNLEAVQHLFFPTIFFLLIFF